MAEFAEPTKADAFALFSAIEKKFPHSTVGDDKWYLITVSAQLRSSLYLSVDICYFSSRLLSELYLNMLLICTPISSPSQNFPRESPDKL